jgi:hypothetical protein
LVIDAFASSYQVARQLKLINSDAAQTGLQVSAYAAVELDSSSHQSSPDGAVIGVGRDRYANIHGSLKVAAVQGQLLRFVQRMLQHSADGSGQRIDAIMVFASPAADAACDVYSIPKLSSIGLSLDDMGRLQQPHNAQQQEMVRQLQQQLYEADRHVSSVLEMYRMIQALCAAADEAVQAGQSSTTTGDTPGGAANNHTAVQALQPTLTRLVMVGPWNEQQLLLPLTTPELEASRQRAAAAIARQRRGLRLASAGASVISYTTASDTADDEGESDVPDVSVPAPGSESDAAEVTAAAAELQDDAGAMEVVPLGLHRRPFLEPQLAGSLTGGDLQVGKQPWCMFGQLSGELPPLAVITDMQPALPDGGCICGACDAESNQVHEAEADGAAGDRDAGRNAVQERPVQPVWPEAFVLTVMRMLQGQVVAERAAAAQRARDSAAAAAAARSGGRQRKRGSSAANAAGSRSGDAAAPQQGVSANTAAAKKQQQKKSSASSSSSSSSRAAIMLAPPAPGVSEQERWQQLQLFTKPVLAEFARTAYGLPVKTKIKKYDLTCMIFEDERAKGKLVSGSQATEEDAGGAESQSASPALV